MIRGWGFTVPPPNGMVCKIQHRLARQPREPRKARKTIEKSKKTTEKPNPQSHRGGGGFAPTRPRAPAPHVHTGALARDPETMENH